MLSSGLPTLSSWEDNSDRQPQLEPMQLSTTVMGPSSVAKPCGVEGGKKRHVGRLSSCQSLYVAQ